MFTDMVGFTTAAQSDEAKALETLREQEELVRPVLATHHGRSVKSTGDGLLAEFDSALHAVQCAIAIHEAIRERNANPGVAPFYLRVGVHLGDVEERGGDIFGDAVNIAARIEPLALPGGICVSGPVFDQVRNKLATRFEKLPPTDLKHVRVPVDLYRVALPWDPTESAASPAQRSRLAVLPLSNISPDPHDEYIADGLTEELITVLSKLSGVRVIARTSVNQYKSTTKPVSQIGTELGVGSVLEGSVRKAGNRVRITLQLIDVGTQEHLWANTYDRELDDVFAIQTDIAERTAHGLRVELVGPQRSATTPAPSVNVAAYDAYLKGLHAASSVGLDSVERAVPFFEEAIRLDPEMAAAYAGLANTYVKLSGDTLAPSVAFPRAKELLAKALELDPNASDAHTAAGNLALQREQAWDVAESEFRIAIRLNPSDAEAHRWYSLLLRTLGRPDEAFREARYALDLDPLSLFSQVLVIQACWALGDFEGATVEIRKVMEAHPELLALRCYLASAHLVLGRRAEALRELDSIPEPTDPESRVNLALVSALAGRPDRARALRNQLEAESRERYVSPMSLAVCYAVLGDRDRMFEILEREQESGERSFWFIYSGNLFDPIRDDPRFLSLLERAGLPTAPPPSARLGWWRATTP
jgi:adenylate cyclase